MEYWVSSATLAALLASAALGFALQPFLNDVHRSRATTDVIWIMVGMLATFASLVLGLLTSSQKTSFDEAHRERARYAASIVREDRCLRLYGPETEPIRAILGRYTSLVIASTWPDETAPPDLDRAMLASLPRVGESAVLAEMLTQADLAIRRLRPADAMHATLAADCVERFQDLMQSRFSIFDEVRPLALPFYAVLIFWLTVIFVCFGLFAPRNALVITVLALSALSLAVAMFVVVDLSTPYTGLFRVPSTEMRGALAHILAPSRA